MTGGRARFGSDRPGAAEFDLSLSRTPDEGLASINGMIATLTLQMGDKPGRPTRGAFHSLRCAARRDPISAYNLGNFLAESIGEGPPRPRRRVTSLRLFERAAIEGMSRLLNASAPFKAAPPREHEMRDIVSRALTNIGAAIANLGQPQKAVTYFEQAVAVFPANGNAFVCLGNMGVHHGEVTGIDALAGIANWEEAARVGDYCHESSDGCPCRANVVHVARQIERDYGVDAAEAWVIRNYRAGRKRGSGNISQRRSFL